MKSKNDQNTSCSCVGAIENIVLACSGAADVGYITDQVARKLSRSKARKMNCLAMVAAADTEKIDEFRQKNILVIDGCNGSCGKSIMDKTGLSNYTYARLTDLGFEKGKTSTSIETVNEVYDKVVMM